MIYTTYFAKLSAIPSNVVPISICGLAPDWYKGIQYKKLAPKYDFFMKWKETRNNEYYIEHFKSEVLDHLSATEIVNELEFIVSNEINTIISSPIYTNKNWHIALVCYEKPTDFCHRHLVARTGYVLTDIR